MSVDKFKFVSPGVFLDEIDESGIPALPERMGPIIVGRFRKGPGNRPIKVSSYKEFARLFGDPAPGNASGDIWRTGEMTAPTYAAYAVKAWLRNNSPCTVYRVLGEESPNADTGQTSQAGWITDDTFDSPDIDAVGGAYGLFVFPSSSAPAGLAAACTGTLAAIWYVQDGAVILTGTARDTKPREGAGVLILSEGGTSWTAKISGSTGIKKTAKFDFNRDSDTFIRKVFNTDPTKTNSEIVPSTDTTLTYWLGETFESNVRDGENSKLKTFTSHLTSSVVANGTDTFAAILALDGNNGPNSSTIVWADHKQTSRAAQTGWFISQDTRGSTTGSFNPISHTEKLFKLHCLDSGEQGNRDYKVSISDIKVPTDNFNKYGSFTVQIRKSTDRDSNPVVLESFSGCNLNPTSPNYIGRKIGDRFYTYDDTNKRIIEHGDNENRSNIARVEIAPVIADGGGEGLNPYGVYGPTVPKNQEVRAGGANPEDATRVPTKAIIYAAGSSSISVSTLPNQSLAGNTTHKAGHLNTHALGGHKADTLLHFLTGSTRQFSASIEWPTSRLRESSSEGSLVIPSKAYFGYQSTVKNTRRFDKSNLDLFRGQPATLDPTAIGDADLQQYSWIFTLDDVRQSVEDNRHSVWVSGSRAGNMAIGGTSPGTSWTALSGTSFILTGSGAGFRKFTSPMFGGFDGYDITEKDPFRNSYMAGSPTEANNSSFYSLKKAIDVVADKDFLEYDVASLPGITNTSLTSQLVTACEDRGDSLAVIDVPGGYKPPHERATSETSDDALGSVNTTVANLKDMNLNSSYGCAFYPWVKIRDNVANSMIYVPPSVVALGTLSSAQRRSAVWFAPAGFTRGGLSEGSSGLPVVGVRQRLTSDERDKLYDANINPIASFPAEGIVIFGQKTLQVTPSALDRINVRRLLIYVKKEISRIASRILFDQNVQQTWDRFKGQVEPFLEGVQAGLGLTDFRVVLDNETTTPDLVDRNIMYAKIFLKPARAIEFIALDFIITRSGASFDD